MPARTRPRARTIPTLLGLIYAVPYQVLEPDLAFVIDGPQGVAGYLLRRARHARLQCPAGARVVSAPAGRDGRPRTGRSCWHGSDWARHQIHHPDFDIPEALDALSLARPYRPAARRARQGHRQAGDGVSGAAPCRCRFAGAVHAGRPAQRGCAGTSTRRSASRRCAASDLPAHSVYVTKRLGAG